MKKISLLFFAAGFCLHSYSQKLHLDVMLSDKKIGNIDVVSKTKAKLTTFEMTSKVQVKMLLDVTVESKTNNTYQAGKLISSKAFRHSNVGGEDKNTSVEWNGKNYTIQKNKEPLTALNKEISYCVTDLYFKEPVGITQVFSEAQGSFLPLVAKPNHVYELQVNDGKKDLFAFKNGKLIQVESVIAMQKVLFVVK